MTAVTIRDSREIFALFEEFKGYLNATVNELYLSYGSLTGPTGLPFTETSQKIEEFIPSCKGETIETLPPNITETLSASTLWGKFGDIPSLEFQFNPQYYNSSFLQCLFNKTNEYVENYRAPGSTFLTTGLVTCLSLAALICVGCCLYAAASKLKQYYYGDISSESTPLTRRLFRSKQNTSLTSLQELPSSTHQDTSLKSYL